MAQHADFQALPWARTLLSDPNLRVVQDVPKDFQEGMAPNTMFYKLLYKPGAINAHVTFQRPSRESDAVTGVEEGMLLSLGHDIDGKHGRAHGGFNGMILDQLCGSCAHHAILDPIPPATATLTVDYKAPVSTPCVIVARAWLIEHTGRKVWMRAVLQDGEGKVLASAKALFLGPKTASL